MFVSLGKGTLAPPITYWQYFGEERPPSASVDSHSECIGLHFVLCSTKKVWLSCSGTRFNRLTFVRMSTKSRDTGLYYIMTHTLFTLININFYIWQVKQILTFIDIKPAAIVGNHATVLFLKGDRRSSVYCSCNWKDVVRVWRDVQRVSKLRSVQVSGVV